ncbi:hypothetical protein NM208_g14652 [Fusarium decemcellulare]|uniref:Uncharacterized protein n=1 Tax=Fusarium decemcellulare TaxID=57161 RepID=A0ACC1RIS8_9HYPO|nr:hypothetical protein NM208_g14652 [Fusarium decemcellulare]
MLLHVSRSDEGIQMDEVKDQWAGKWAGWRNTVLELYGTRGAQEQEYGNQTSALRTNRTVCVCTRDSKKQEMQGKVEDNGVEADLRKGLLAKNGKATGDVIDATSFAMDGKWERGRPFIFAPGPPHQSSSGSQAGERTNRLWRAGAAHDGGGWRMEPGCIHDSRGAQGSQGLFQ